MEARFHVSYPGPTPMSERGLLLSEIVAQLVTDARRHEGLSTDELADRAGLHRGYVGMVERRSRQPSLAVAADLAEALGLSLSDLVAEAEQDAGNGRAPQIEFIHVPPRRAADVGHLGKCSAAPLDHRAHREMVVQRDRTRLPEARSDRRPDARVGHAPDSAGLVDVPDLAALVADMVGSGVARASSGLYVQNGPDHSPSLLPLRQGCRSMEVIAALETDRPGVPEAKAGAHPRVPVRARRPERGVHARKGQARGYGRDLGGSVRGAGSGRFPRPLLQGRHSFGPAEEGSARSHGARLLRPRAPAVREGGRRLRPAALRPHQLSSVPTSPRASLHDPVLEMRHLR